jgi:hypothetical protein
LKVIAAALLLVLISNPSATAGGAVRGFGGKSCGSWLEARAAQEDDRYQDWLDGFLTGVNWYQMTGETDAAASTDEAGMDYWLDGYCRQHPTVVFAFAASALLQSFHPELQRR